MILKKNIIKREKKLRACSGSYRLKFIIHPKMNINVTARSLKIKRSKSHEGLPHKHFLTLKESTPLIVPDKLSQGQGVNQDKSCGLEKRGMLGTPDDINWFLQS